MEDDHHTQQVTDDIHDNHDSDDEEDDIELSTSLGFTSPDDVAKDNHVYNKCKYMNSYTWVYYNYGKGDTLTSSVSLSMVKNHVLKVGTEELGHMWGC